MTAVDDLRAEALFCSHLQPSDRPLPALVRTTVYAEVFRRREDGCVACVAQESGDHPEASAERMRWARAAVAGAFEFEPAVVSDRLLWSPAVLPRRLDSVAARPDVSDREGDTNR